MPTLVRHWRVKDYIKEEPAEGEEERAKEVARALPRARLVLYSNTVRAKQTAAVIAAAQGGVAITVDPRFGEILDLSDPEFKVIHEQAKRELPSADAGIAAVCRYRPFLQELEEASQELLSSLRNMGDDVIVVTHNVTMLGIWLHMNGRQFTADSWREYNPSQLETLHVV